MLGFDGKDAKETTEGNTMNKKHKDWAMRHDWADDFVMIGRNYYGQDLYLVTTNTGERFTDYAEMRAWAGY